MAEQAGGEHAANARFTLDQMQVVVHDRTRAFISPPPTSSMGKKRRNVYDAGNRRVLPGRLVRSEKTNRSADAEAGEAYDGAGATYDFWSSLFGRNSIDGNGLRIDSTVHYGVRFANAMWNGKQIIYGDGDGRFFGRFTSALDVIAHELTHGVTQHSAGLVYNGQSGALNEHVSDAFGIMVKQFTLGQSASESNWRLGEGLLLPGVNGRAIRSMAAPGTAYDDPILGQDPQPAHMSNYVNGIADNGGIHINSGIPNHAFYLAAVAIGGNTWSVLGKIWYEVLTKRLKAQDDFQRFANLTTQVAGEFFGFGGMVQLTVGAAWTAVGLPTPAGLLVPPATAALQGAGVLGTGRTAKWRKHPICATK